MSPLSFHGCSTPGHSFYKRSRRFLYFPAHAATAFPRRECRRRALSKPFMAATTAIAKKGSRFIKRNVSRGTSFLPAFSNEVPQAIDMLDFGGGDGAISRSIAGLLLKAGASRIHIALVDYNAPVDTSDAKQILVSRHESLEEIAGRTFHLAVASAIIEHIPHPRAELASLCRSLKPGGILYIRTPNMVPIGRVCRALGIPFDFTFPAHVHDLGQTFWRRIWSYLPLAETPVEVLRSRPSIVETTLPRAVLRTLGAYLLKAPWYVLGDFYGFVGGWEIFVRRREADVGRASV